MSKSRSIWVLPVICAHLAYSLAPSSNAELTDSCSACIQLRPTCARCKQEEPYGETRCGMPSELRRWGCQSSNVVNPADRDHRPRDRCDCERTPMSKAAQCGGRGTYACGICACQLGWSGPDCRNSTTTLPSG